MHRFWDIRLGSIQWPWNPGLGSLKIIENDTIRSGTHDFLLTFRSNRRPISHRVFIAPAEGVTLQIWYRRSGQKKTRMMGLRTRWLKKFYDRFNRLNTMPACDSQPPSQPRCRSKYRAIGPLLRVARVKTVAALPWEVRKSDFLTIFNSNFN